MSKGAAVPAVAPGSPSPPRTTDAFIALVVIGDFQAAKKIATSLNNPIATMIITAEAPLPPGMGNKTNSRPTAPKLSSQSKIESGRTSFALDAADEFLMQYFNVRNALSRLSLAASSMPSAPRNRAVRPWVGATDFDTYYHFEGVVGGFEAIDTGGALREVAGNLARATDAGAVVDLVQSPGGLVVRGVMAFWGTILLCIADLVDELTKRRSPFAMLAALHRGRVALEQHVRFLDETVEFVATGQPRVAALRQEGGASGGPEFTSYAVLSAKLRHPLTAQLRNLYWALWARCVLLVHDVAWLTFPDTSAPLLGGATTTMAPHQLPSSLDLGVAADGATSSNTNTPRTAALGGGVAQQPTPAVTAMPPRFASSYTCAAADGTESVMSDTDSAATDSTTTTATAQHTAPQGAWSRFKQWFSSNAPKPLPPVPQSHSERRESQQRQASGTGIGSSGSGQTMPQRSLSNLSGESSSRPSATHSHDSAFDEVVRPALVDHGRHGMVSAIAAVLQAARARPNCRSARLYMLFDSNDGADGFRFASEHAVCVSREYSAVPETAHGMHSWVVAFAVPRLELSNATTRRDVVVQSVCTLNSPKLSGYTTKSSGVSLWLVRPTVPHGHPGLVLFALECVISAEVPERGRSNRPLPADPVKAADMYYQEQETALRQCAGEPLGRLARQWSLDEQLTKDVQRVLRFGD